MGGYPWYVSLIELKTWLTWIEAEGEMKHEDRLEIQKGKADREAAETKAKAKAAAEDKKDKA
jgi:hypothetical protein